MANKLLHQKYSNKKVNAKKEGIPFYLTINEFIRLLKDANITAEDIGIKKYHLARYNDIGPYSYDNCRFIYYKENYAEKKISDKARKASSQNISRYNKAVTKEERSKIAKKIAEKRKKYKNGNILSEDEILRRLNIIKSCNPEKRGWIMRSAKELNISHTQVRRFINKYYKE